jgi:hypothetical protein
MRCMGIMHSLCYSRWYVVRMVPAVLQDGKKSEVDFLINTVS